LKGQYNEWGQWYEEDCLPYLEDYEFWSGIRESNVWFKDENYMIARSFWN